MSKWGKIFISVAVVLLLGVFVIPNLFALDWLNLYWVLLGLSLLLLLVAAIVDRKFYLGFFLVRTTRHGFSMGALTVLVFAFLLCINYLANRHNVTIDLTSEKLNSLSEQTVKILKGIRDDVKVKIFYQGNGAAQGKADLKQSLRAFSDLNSKFQAEFINSYENNALAMEYLSSQTDKASSPIIGFLEFKGKRVRISWPISEEQVTSALIKATRQGEKKIYFTSGHGERDLASENEEGLSQFVESLKEATYQAENLGLLEVTKIPEDAAMVAVIGPSAPFLEQEIQLLRDFARAGGRLLLAIDPMQRHNLANLTKSLGVEFANNVVISVSPRITGRGEWTVAATQFDATNEVTSTIPAGSYVVMDLASQVQAAFDKSSNISVTELVKTSERSYAVVDPRSVNANEVKMQSQSVAVMVKASEIPEAKSFEAIIFGDSDFLANKALMLYSNRDLALNSVALLTNETDLISLRPKLPKGTIIALTQINRNLFVLASLMVPIFLMTAGTFVWWRRRGA